MTKQKKKEKLTVKKVSGKLHLWLGLGSGLVVFVVSITGCLFVFQEEIRNLIHKEVRFVTPVANASFVTVDKIEQAIKASYPNEKIKQIRTYSNPDRAWQVYFEKDKVVAVNPYTAAIIKQYNKKDWLNVVEELHTSLLLGDTGKWIIRINVVIFLALLISGIILWWPGNKARRKQSFRVKWDASGKRINYDFHNVFGFYSSVFLLLIVLTGMYMSFDWMKRATYFATGSEFKKPQPSKIQADEYSEAILTPSLAYTMASRQYPGAVETHINYPKKMEEPIKIKMHYATSTYRKINEVQYNPYTGNIANVMLFKNYSAGDKIKHSNLDLHTGAFFGMTGKILAFLFSLIAASMPVTGFAIWWVRNKKKKPAVKRAVPAKQVVAQQIARAAEIV